MKFLKTIYKWFFGVSISVVGLIIGTYLINHFNNPTNLVQGFADSLASTIDSILTNSVKLSKFKIELKHLLISFAILLLVCKYNIFLLLLNALNLPIYKRLNENPILINDENSVCHIKKNVVILNEGTVSTWVYVGDGITSGKNSKTGYRYVWGTSCPSAHINWANFFGLRFVTANNYDHWQVAIHDDEGHDLSTNKYYIKNYLGVDINKDEVGDGWKLFVVKWKVDLLKNSRDIELSVFCDGDIKIKKAANNVYVWPVQSRNAFFIGNWGPFDPNQFANTRLYKFCLYGKWASDKIFKRESKNAPLNLSGVEEVSGK